MPVFESIDVMMWPSSRYEDKSHEIQSNDEHDFESGKYELQFPVYPNKVDVASDKQKTENSDPDCIVYT